MFWNKERKVNVFMPQTFYFFIKDALYVFPNSIGMWPQNHTAAYAGIISELTFLNYLRIPLAYVLALFNRNTKLFSIFSCHKSTSKVNKCGGTGI